MKKNQKKEQILAVITLCGVFILFLFLKMNPDNSSVVSNENIKNKVTKIVEKKVVEIKENNLDVKVSAKDTNLKSKPEIKAIESFTDKELKRAQAYLKKRWAYDETINMAAWKHANQVKNNNKNTELANKKSDINNQIVSSSN